VTSQNPPLSDREPERPPQSAEPLPAPPLGLGPHGLTAYWNALIPVAGILTALLIAYWAATGGPPALLWGICLGLLLLTGATARYVQQQARAMGAERIALAGEHERRIEELDARSRSLSLLYATAGTIAGSLDLETVLGQTAQAAQRALRAAGALVATCDPHLGELRIRAACGFGRRLVAAPELGGFALSLARTAAECREPALAGFVERYEVRLPIQLRALGLEEALLVPLRTRNQTVGVVVLLYEQQSGLGPDELRLAAALASQAAVATDNANLYETTDQELKATVAKLQALVGGLLAVGTADEVEVGLAVAAEQARSIVPCRTAFFLVAEPDRRELRCRAAAGTHAAEPTEYRLGMGALLGGAAAERCATLVLPDPQSPEAWPPALAQALGRQPRSSVAVPVLVEQECWGVLELHDRTGAEAFGAEDVTLLAAFAAHVGLSLHKATLLAETRELSRRDALTGLHNRRSLMERLTDEVARSRRFGTPLSVLLLDLDGFKEVNDEHGHPAGDRVLVEVAELLQSDTRTIDTVARLGGDEFAVLLAGTPPESAQPVAERICSLVAAHAVALPDSGSAVVRTSIGVAGCEPGASEWTPAALLQAADTALYEAKRAGKNTVRLHEGPPPQAADQPPGQPAGAAA